MPIDARAANVSGRVRTATSRPGLAGAISDLARSAKSIVGPRNPFGCCDALIGRSFVRCAFEE